MTLIPGDYCGRRGIAASSFCPCGELPREVAVHSLESWWIDAVATLAGVKIGFGDFSVMDELGWVRRAG